jgi:hypothetical protein
MLQKAGVESCFIAQGKNYAAVNRINCATPTLQLLKNSATFMLVDEKN